VATRERNEFRPQLQLIVDLQIAANLPIIEENDAK
jgi:hypothetical protein